MIQFRGARYIDDDRGWIECEINHPELGWIPFTCPTEDDPGTPINTAELYAAMADSGEVAPPVKPSLDDLKIEAADNIMAYASDARARIAGHADQYKLAGWNDKAQRARRVLVGEASQADLAVLQIEADKRGQHETAEQLAQKQAQKAERLAVAISVIDGLESFALKAIEGKRTIYTLENLLTELKRQADSELEKLSGAPS